MGALGYGVGKLGAASIPVWVLYIERSLASIGIALVALAAKQLSTKLLTDKTTSTLAAIAATLVINFSYIQWLIPVIMVCGGVVTYLETFGPEHYQRFQEGKSKKTDVESGSALPPPVTANENEALVDGDNVSEIGNRNSIHLEQMPSAASVPKVDDTVTGNPPEEKQDLRIYFSYSMATGAALIAIFFLLLITAAILRSQNVTQALNILSTFYFVGAIIFGGGPVVVPLLYSYVVSGTGWLTPTEFLMGFAIINIMPGIPSLRPNFNFAAFCGALAYRTDGWTTFVGALLAWIGIFLPGLIIKAGILPIWRHHRDLPALRAVFRGLNSIAVGLLFAAVYLLWMKAIALPGGGVDNLGSWPGWTAAMIAAILAVDVWKIEPYWVVLAGVAIGGIVWAADGRPVAQTDALSVPVKSTRTKEKVNDSLDGRKDDGGVIFPQRHQFIATKNTVIEDDIPAPDRNDRKIYFGIDCAELVHFTHWEPGGEHVKHLIVKNVVMKTQKIKYKLPKTRFFSMEFPETVTLSAGMSWTIPITFRPVAKVKRNSYLTPCLSTWKQEAYNDVIEFTTSFGKFYLPIKATLPEHDLAFAPSVDFMLCPVKEVARKTFQLSNIGELDSHFEWEVSKPFSITPHSGTLASGAGISVNIEFCPEDASVFTEQALCIFGDLNNWEMTKVSKPLMVYGIGKYCHLVVNGGMNDFDFGQVYVGKSAERIFSLVNLSPVVANFKVRPTEKNPDPYFEFSHHFGSIGPQKSMDLTVKYTPVAAEILSTEYFDITTVSGNSVKLKCSGSGTGPKVSLNTSLVNFNDVVAGSSCTRPIYLQNDSQIAAYYQFLAEHHSTFFIDKPSGTINANSSIALTVKFSPTEPINYYRRVYCLVENQDGIYIDFIGTCYNDKRRPATFFPKMLENYEQRVKAGLWNYGPEHLEEMLKNNVIESKNGVLRFVHPEKHTGPEQAVDRPYKHSKVSSQYFHENTFNDRQPVILRDCIVDFGSCSIYRPIDHRIIRITNSSVSKMSCVWCLPDDDTSGEPVFSVSPRVCDINPKATVEFRIIFRPTAENAFYGQQLECFVYFKSMRNFRLVNPDTFTPPFCLTPTVAGNTFPPGQETFVPKVELSATRIDFPACNIDNSSYRTVRISNTGDTPVKFEFEDLQVLEMKGLQQSQFGGSIVTQPFHAISVKPRVGLLRKNDSQLVDFNIRGVGFLPHLTFENENLLLFKPTCLNTFAERLFSVRNNSKISVNFEWRIPKQYENLVSIEPRNGNLSPNGTMTLKFESEGDIQYQTKRSSLTVMASGIKAEITPNAKSLPFGAILVNTIVEQEMTIFNHGECDIFYDLEIHGVDDSENSASDIENILPNNIRESEIEITNAADSFPSRSKQVLRVRACLREQIQRLFRVYYRMKPQSATANSSLAGIRLLQYPLVHLFDVTVLGVHPVVMIVDARSHNIGKALLWEYFSLNQFNHLLSAISKLSPSINSSGAYELEDEFDFPTERVTGGEFKEEPSTDFNFGAAPLGSNATEVYFRLFNPGVVPVEWIFFFPNDLEVEIENWADPGDYSEDQLHTNLILDNRLFTIVPKVRNDCVRDLSD
ncbi:hypothetical protein HDU84_004761 [Entophlyctis sp. JEL0112]|nr:hypothetical protein HDU84_004761 [Entophlyctis sp. JEL0112]